MSQRAPMNCCFSRAVKYRSVHSDRLCRSALSEWEGFKDSGKVREAFCCSLLFCLAPLIGDKLEEATLVQLAHEWAQSRFGRKEKKCGSRGGKGLLLEPSSAADWCLQERLSAEEAALHSSQYSKEHPQTMHMGDDAVQLQREVYPEVIFICLFL